MDPTKHPIAMIFPGVDQPHGDVQHCFMAIGKGTTGPSNGLHRDFSQGLKKQFWILNQEDILAAAKVELKKNGGHLTDIVTRLQNDLEFRRRYEVNIRNKVRLCERERGAEARCYVCFVTESISPPPPPSTCRCQNRLFFIPE